MKYINEWKYKIYVDRHDGKGMELSAWYDNVRDAWKEAQFLKSKGYEVEIR